MKALSSYFFRTSSARKFFAGVFGIFFAFGLLFSSAVPAYALTFEEVDVICFILGCTEEQKEALYALVSDDGGDGIEIDDFDTDTEVIFEADDAGEVSVGEFTITFDVSSSTSDMYLDKSTEDVDGYDGGAGNGSGNKGEGVVYDIDAANGATPDSVSAVLECVVNCGDTSDNTADAFFIEEGDTEEYRLTVTVVGDSSMSDDFKVFLESVNWSLTSSSQADKFFTRGLGEGSDSDTGYLFLKSLGTGGEENEPPVFISSHVIKPDKMEVGDVAVFIWEAEDPDGDGISWSVDWGDRSGQDGTCPVPEGKGETFVAFHSWKAEGEYSVEPFASDCHGNTTVGHGHTFRIIVGDSDTELPNLTVISPNGGEEWKHGSRQLVKWETSGVPRDARIKIGLRHSKSGSDFVLTSKAYNDGRHTVTIPEKIPSGAYLLFAKTSVSGETVDDWSDGKFTIGDDDTSSGNPPTATLSAPIRVIAGEEEEWGVNAQDIDGDELVFRVEWDDRDAGNTKPVFVKRETKTNWHARFEHTYEDAGDYYPVFTVDDQHGNVTRVVGEVIVQNEGKPYLYVKNPDGSRDFEVGDRMYITWGSENYPRSEPVEITLREIVPNKPPQSSYDVADNTPNDGSYSWSIPKNIPDGEYKIFITCGDSEYAYVGCSGRASARPFHIGEEDNDIEPTIRYISPRSGEPGDSVAIYGANLNHDGSEYIEIMGEKIGVHQTFSPYYRSDSKLKFEIPSVPVGYTYSIRVGQKAGEQSNWVSLAVEAPEEERDLTIAFPGKGSVWTLGNREYVRWTDVNFDSPSTIHIYLVKGYGDSPDIAYTITTSAYVDSDQYSFILPNNLKPDDDYRVLIQGKGGINEYSDMFKIVGDLQEEKSISITNPNGGDRIARGTKYQIQWNSWGNIPEVDIFMTSKGGSNCGDGFCTGAYFPSVRYDIAPGVSNVGYFTIQVGYDHSRGTMPDGAYTLDVCDSTGKPCDSESVTIETFSDNDDSGPYSGLRSGYDDSSQFKVGFLRGIDYLFGQMAAVVHAFN